MNEHASHFVPDRARVYFIALVLMISAWRIAAAELELDRHLRSGRVVFARVPEDSAHVPHSPTNGQARAAVTNNAANDGTDPRAASDAFLQEHAKSLGINRIVASLRPLRLERDKLGMSHVRYEQQYQGFSVFAAEAIVHVGNDGTVRSVSTDVVPNLNPNLKGTIPASSAASEARALWQAQFRNTNGVAYRMRQCIFAPVVINHDNDTNAWLVWEVKMRSRRHQTQNYYLDAQNGAVRFQTTETYNIDRAIFDCSADPGSGQCYCNLTNSTEFDSVYVFGRSEGTPDRGPNPRFFPYTLTDDDNAYDFFGQLLTMYQDVLGRDGGNGVGGTGDGISVPSGQSFADTFIDFLDGVSCPNAYFAQGKLEFCKGQVAPDAFAHEYAHAVPYFSILDALGEPGGMVYEGETGALNENYADVSGEIFEGQIYGSIDWLEGFTTLNGPIRNFADPPAIADPPYFYADRYHSPYFYCGSQDFSGVHLKSTVPTKAAYLLSEGGTFNGCTISAIGSDRVYQIWYRALTIYYSRTETFNGAMAKLVQSARDLYPAEPETILQVQRALQAVEMDQTGTCSGKPETAPLAVDAVGW